MIVAENSEGDSLSVKNVLCVVNGELQYFFPVALTSQGIIYYDETKTDDILE